MKYPYKCLACSHEFDVELKLKDVVNAAKFPKIKCPVCKGTTKKLPGKVVVHFKGNGFYSTDNKKETK